MVNISQKRDYLRVSLKIVAKVSNEQFSRIVQIEDISVAGAKVYSDNLMLQVGDIINIEFKYRKTIYTVIAQVIRNIDEDCFGVKFFFQPNETSLSNKQNLFNDINTEFFKISEYLQNSVG